MSALGKGLASLIPKRNVSAKELLRRIDDDELDFNQENDAPAEPAKELGKTHRSTKIDVTQDSEEDAVVKDDMPATSGLPRKPFTTPIPLTPEVTAETVPATVNDSPARRHEESVVQIKVAEIKLNPLQPRRAFDQAKMDELIASVAAHGILQPLVVLRLDNDGYELLAGERRLRAAKKLGWDEVPCVVRKGVRTARSSLELALVENLQRRDLDPIETAQAFKRLSNEYGLSHEEIAQHVGISRAAVTNIMRFLQLPEEVQAGLAEGKITQAHARAVLMIPDAEKQLKFYQQMVRDKVSVRQAEVRARRVRRAMNVTDRRREKGSSRVMLARRWTAPLEEQFGSLVKVRFLPAKNRFEVVFIAFTEQELDDVVKRLISGEKDDSIAEVLAEDAPDDQDE